MDEEKIGEILNGLDQDERVLKMKEFIQHGRVTTYDHCKSVAKTSYKINKGLHLSANEKQLLTGALLHDYYLYDWHTDGEAHPLHGYHHADTAVENARQAFSINEKEQEIIWSHMWPLNITRIPRSREAWIVCVADKLVSIKETLFMR